MARQTPRRTAWTIVALIAGVALLTVGAWGLSEWQPFADDEPEVAWPENIRPLAEFVEHETGLRFLRPVQVEFIEDADAYAARTAAAPVDDTGRALADTDTAVGRALGFWSGDMSVLESATSIRSATDFASQWFPDEETVVVNAADAKSDLSAIDRSELIVLLTEVLDDQHFDIADRLATAASPQHYQALLGLDIGEALWVHDRYVDDLDSDDTDSLRADEDERGAAYSDAIDDIPASYRALRVVAQNLGPTFVAALHETDDNAVEHAFDVDTPAALDQVSLPVGKYEHRDEPETAAPPAIPHGAEFLSTRQMGPFGVYMLLAAAVPARDALTASDGWGNDGFTAYRLDGRVCVDARIVADSRADADRMEVALQAWAAARPSESDALLGRDDDALLISVCDPGPDVEQTTIGDDALEQYFGRANLMADRIDLTGKPDLAECVAVSFFRKFDLSDLGLGTSVDIVGELESMTEDCAGSV